jgi:hypothetical protein
MVAVLFILLPLNSIADSEQVRTLLKRAGLKQRAAARGLAISERMMRYYVDGAHPVPRSILLALESLTGAPEFLERLSARVRVEAGCTCGDFQILTNQSDKSGQFPIISALKSGRCQACAAGISVEVASRLLAMSGLGQIDMQAARQTPDKKRKK